MRASTAAARASPRSCSTRRTSDSISGRPSTTARIRSTTSPRATPAPSRSKATKPVGANVTRARATGAGDTPTSKRMADGEVDVVGRLAGAPVELVAPIHPQRAQRALVAQPHSRGVAQVAQAEVRDEGIDVAHVAENRGREVAA